jgi:predicted O-linked N-acetylglucosamine transferase (SPINDLY family)
MTVTADWLAAGWAALQADRPAEAEHLGRAATEAAPAEADGWWLLGVACHCQGRQAEAVHSYTRALAVRPDHPETLINLAAALHELGRPAEAERHCRRALAVRPDAPVARQRLGRLLRDQGQLTEATEAFRQAQRLRPDSVDVLNDLGNALQESGRPSEAATCFRQMLALQPDLPEAHFNLGNALLLQGLPDDAAASYRQALALRPDYVEARINLGNALRGRGQLGAAAECYEQVLALQPDLPDVYFNLGNTRRQMGQPAAAAARYREALHRRPDFPDAWNNLGLAMANLGRPADAEECFRQASAQRPDDPAALNHRAGALRDLGRLGAAEASLRRAVALRPDYPEAYHNLGIALRDQGRIEEALAAFRQAQALWPESVEAHSERLLTLQYQGGVTPDVLAAAHAEYQRRFAAPLRARWRPHANDRSPDRPLRLGFVSGDFGRHAVGVLAVRALEALARRACTVVCYSNRRKADDDLTARFRAASVWRVVVGLSDEQLAEQVRADAIDVLIDLAGHTANNRLLAFAGKPAPVQATWLGYVGTTGLDAMDYLIADDQQVPPGADRDYRERVLRLAGGYACYDPPAGAPDPGPPPAATAGRVTFGCFNYPAKLSPPALAAFAAVLARVPGARLVLKYGGLDDPAVANRVRAVVAAAGADADRVELRGGTGHADHLAAYRDIDVALDPFPYSGGVTTCDALWMGVPVVTLPGPTFAGRHALSYLARVGLADELAARDADDYVARAASLASDPGRLADLRVALRDRVVRSPLCDGGRLADALLAAVREAWRTWVASGDKT